MDPIKNKQLGILSNIQNQITLEKGEGGDGFPGERRKWKDGWYTKQDNGKWQKDKNQEDSPQPQEKPKQEYNPITYKEQLSPTLQEKFEKVKDKVENIITSDTAKVEQLKQLIDLGFSDEEALVALTALPLSHVIQYNKDNKTQSTVSTATQQKVLEHVGKMPTLKAADRWNTYDGYIDMVLENEARGLICYGRGGVGKTYTLQQKLKEATNPRDGSPMKEFDVELDNLPQEYDYCKISGKATPVGLFQSLWEHNGKLIIYDDCDSVLEDKDGLSMLKAVLDTSGDQVVSYSTSSKMKDNFGMEIPQRFKFKGRIIFITNIDTKKFIENPHLAAVKTRNLTIDLSMTADETMGRLKDIMPKMKFEDNDGQEIEVSDQTKEDVYNFIMKYKDKTELNNLNARVFGNMAKIKNRFDKNPNAYGGVSWENVALNLLA